MTENNNISNYTDDNIRTLEDRDHVRLRPGMYIGKLGDGTHSDDGIYVLIKEALDNSIDEFRMGEGKNINITVKDGKVTVRDFGRGIPQGFNKDGHDVMIIATSKLNSGAKYDSKAFKKSVGLNGVGLKAVNFLSWKFSIQSWRDGKTRRLDYKQGILVSDSGIIDNTENQQRGTYIEFEPDKSKGIFENYVFRDDFIEQIIRNYSYLNTGLTINYNGQKFISKNGLLDLLTDRITSEPLYPIIHLKADDIEIAFTHSDQYGEEYYSFVNGQYTSQGGTHQSSFKEHIARTIKEYYGKNFEPQDIRSGIVAAIAINVIEPTFESQTKIKLGSTNMAPEKDGDGNTYPLSGVSVNKFVGDFIKREVDNYLHKNKDISDRMLEKIQSSEKERKAMSGVQKLAREKAKKVSLHNEKLRDCRIHYNSNNPRRDESTIFITEGDSASGSITKSRDVTTQAVFSLRGKPLNSYGKTKKVVYENDEFNLLQAALNIEEGIENIRYKNIVIATDADVDGMHIRLLLITFFLQFFPEVVKNDHLFILETPLFRVRNKQETKYCYTESERDEAQKKIKNSETTRFKGLGEINWQEFKNFIGPDMKLSPVTLSKDDNIKALLEYFMGNNTQERQNFIIENLRMEED